MSGHGILNGFVVECRSHLYHQTCFHYSYQQAYHLFKINSSSLPLQGVQSYVKRPTAYLANLKINKLKKNTRYKI